MTRCFNAYTWSHMYHAYNKTCWHQFIPIQKYGSIISQMTVSRSKPGLEKAVNLMTLWENHLMNLNIINVV